MNRSGTTVESVESGPLPAGTVTMLFTDIEGSTRLLHEVGDETYGALLAQHHELVIGAGQANHGQFVDTHGDAVFMVFTRAVDGVAAAVDAQRALAANPWPVEALRVRMGLHAGTVELRETGYVGAAVHEAARVADAANGGQILVSSVVADLVGGHLPAMTSLLDLGLFDLRDVGRPLGLLRVRHETLVEDDRAPRAPRRSGSAGSGWRPPAQATPLVGREREVAAIRRLLREPEVRLVTLTGPGGTGKTRVAIQVAAETAEEYANGACFVPLAPVADPELIPTAIAQVLDVQAAAGRPMRQTLAAALRDQNLLLVLDNFEQLVTGAPLVSELLADCPGVQVLVTSRAVLHLSGEHDVPVPPLTLPAEPAPSTPNADPVAGVAGAEAVQLFVARAVAAAPNFAVTAVNALDVAEICRRLDGLPLAIELAAARIRTLPPKAIVARLDHRLPLLTGGPRDLPERLQTMRNAIAWSYDALAPEEQALFRRLSVFVGGCTLSAIEALGAAGTDAGASVTPGARSAPETLDLAASLVDASVLRQEETPDGEARFWMLETLREYAFDRLDASGETADLRRRHATYFLAFAEEADAKLAGPEQVSWCERLEREHDNLRAALAWSQADGGPEFALRLTAALGWFWRVRSHLGEGRRWLGAALTARADSSERPSAFSGLDGTKAALRVRALTGAGLLAFAQTDYEAANTWLNEALVLARAAGNSEGEAWALHGLGRVAHLRRDPAQATAFLEESAKAFRHLNDTRGYAYSLFFLAASAGQQQDAERAAALFAESLALLRPLGDTWGLCGLTGMWAQLALIGGDLERSAELNGESLAYGRDLRSQLQISFALWRLAYIAISRGDEERGTLLCAAASTIGERIGVPALPEGRAALDRVHARLESAAFNIAWATGSALTLDHAITEGLRAAADLTAPVAS